MVEQQYLLDSDILIAMLRDRTDKTGIRRRILNAGIENCHCSAVSLSELSTGAYRMGTDRGLFEVSFVSTILDVVPFSASDTDVFGKLKSFLVSAGTPIDDMDLLIAATAISSDMILVTHNQKHFARIPNIKIEDWLS